ncbi:MAG: glycosyltransferase [Bacteroidales bacterium]
MKKVMIISYYWPPGGGAGVHRWLKFAKYLRHYGWEPIVYTPENPEYPETDASLLKDLPTDLLTIRRKIREPYRLYKLFTGRSMGEKIQAGFLSENRKPGQADKLATWLRGNLFIPDARKFWIRPSVRYLSRWLSAHPVDAVVSTGPPHSMHLIALGLKQGHNIPWLADFRDPWSQIDFYHKLRLTPWADKKHKALERRVLHTADRVVTVSNHWAGGLRQLSNRHIDVVTNGFDPEDFLDVPDYTHERFTLTHLGSMNADRNPRVLWEVIKDLVMHVPGFSDHLEIRLIGKTDIAVRQALESLELQAFVNHIPYLPHDKALEITGASAILLLPLNNTPNVMGIAPGKLYEYLALKRPILCVGPPNGDAAGIIQETGSGITLGFQDRGGMHEALLKWYTAFLSGELGRVEGSAGRFSRIALTGQIAEILNGMV